MELNGYLYALSAGATWGFLGIYGAYLSRYGLTGNDIAFVRLFFGFIAGVVYIIKNKNINRVVSLDNIKNIAVIGIVTQGVMNLLLYKSIIIIGTVTATMLLCTGPIFTVILSSIILKEKITTQKIIALAIACIGAVSLITEGDFKNIKFNIIGVTLAGMAGICYGIYPILSRRLKKGTNPLVLTVYSFLVGALVLIPTTNLGKIFELTRDIKTLMVLLTFGLIPTLIPYILFLKSMEYIDTAKASIITMVEIPVSALIGVFILKESFNMYKFLGIVLIVSGIMITKINFEKIRSKKYKNIN